MEETLEEEPMPHLSPLLVSVLACAALAALSWVTSLITGNCSQVDRLWSIAPPLYVVWFAAEAAFRDPRLDVMAVLTVLWGARLTYNFARKGGYRAGSEDYRWPVLRKRLGPFGFQVFNAIFIALYQNVLLFLLALPAWAAFQGRARPFGPLDAFATVGFLLFFAGETIADQQQWIFQSDKHARKARNEAVTHEFLSVGLFAWSRHPNFFCEQAIWWMVFLFALAAGEGWIYGAGALLLTLLFQGSTTFTEKISLEKYPAYAEYRRTTSRLMPWPPRGPR
jgi:steroid 5-alpha reductase family enzyme